MYNLPESKSQIRLSDDPSLPACRALVFFTGCWYHTYSRLSLTVIKYLLLATAAWFTRHEKCDATPSSVIFFWKEQPNNFFLIHFAMEAPAWKFSDSSSGCVLFVFIRSVVSGVYLCIKYVLLFNLANKKIQWGKTQNICCVVEISNSTF